MLDSMNHMTLIFIVTRIFRVKTSRLSYLTRRYNGCYYFTLSIFLHGVISLPDARRSVIN